MTLTGMLPQCARQAMASPGALNLEEEIKEVKGKIQEVEEEIKEAKGEIKEAKGEIKEAKKKPG